ncbi:hypothetical protein ASPNIDRAFT_47596 [Aspergillus niger ATCC 1015]|uniref:Uncharacterized protein n=1 Tax=Aspergillus niger (strain ATCC 1015 / CBS 113.46 / FGSC A1144 / LSHB Ac4 / NCTC 3858a / NRRL 328 / USDA 3528.7) TaxID=380704 RepID=G3YGT2_ASPNA|nr:hypothetical protein ASPNIDRAFT_47596 [Aspergillus niger ATCC 1015]
MRSGLQKPGAIPFLALLVFSLFSLVPSLAKEWDLYNVRLGYIGYRNDVRHVSRVKDNWADVRTTRSRVSGTGWKPWLLDGYYQEFYERKARPRRCAVDAPSRSSFEAAAVFDTDPLAFPARESSAFTRGVRAFKAMVIRQPDESQLLPTFSAEGDAIEQLPTRLSALVNSSVTAAAPPDDGLFGVSPTSNSMIPATSSVIEVSRWLLGLSRASWQQFHITTRPANNLYPPKQQSQSASTPSATPPPPALSQNSTATTAGQSKVAGFQQETEHMRRGSCMAIVIGLVVGVMWF